MDVYKPNNPPSKRVRKAAPEPVCGPSDQAFNIMTDISRGLREACDAVTDGLGPPTKTEYTVREASMLSGLSTKEIRRLMNQGKILARHDPGLGHSWFIPRDEVRRLMPDSGRDGDRRESTEAPKTDLNNNNKKYTN